MMGNAQKRHAHMSPRNAVVVAGAALLTVLSVIGSAAFADDSQQAALRAMLGRQIEAASAGMQMRGHPALDDILGSPGMANEMARASVLGVSTGPAPAEPQPLLASGGFVNFESPQVKPLALSSDGATLLATNTPNNSLLVIDTGSQVGAPMSLMNEIPVGLDPVAVAIQPGTFNRTAWVANFMSDNVSVVDLSLGTVVSVIDVGDEPVNVLFDATGAFAFVVIQGSPADVGGGPLVQEGQLIAIDTSTRQVVNHVFLDCNTPRAAVYNPVTDQVIVAALHSGNNTTVVGELSTQPVILAVAQLFSQTSAIFAASPELGPVWPDPSTNPVVPVSPFVERIVFDPGITDPSISNGWADIIAVLSIDDGMGNLIPDPAMVTLMNQEFGITNADILIQSMIDDAKDTVDHDLIVVDVSDPAGAGLSIVNMLGGVGTTLTGMGINANGEVFVSNLEPLNTVRTEPALKGHFIDHQMVIVVNPQSPGALIVPTDLHDGIPGFNNVNGSNLEAQSKSLANPVDIVFNAQTDPARVTAFVASLGADRVAALHGTTGSVLSRADVGAGPRGLALDTAGSLLYVMNRTDMSITRLDVSDRNNIQPQETLDVFNPEPNQIKNARDFLYSTKRSNNFASSCALCHIDGRLDHLAWDLGDPVGDCQPPPPFFNPPPDPLPPPPPLGPLLEPFICNTPTGPELRNHPMKGPMVTLSLQGLDRHEPLHWRGDHPLFQDFNSAFAGLLGGSEIPDAEMDAFAAFVKTINYGPNPFRNRDDSFKDPAANNGLQTFLMRCDGCHEVSNGGALFGATGDVGFWEFAGPFPRLQLQLVTQLRGFHKKLNSDLYNGFGLIHDGREERESNLPPVVCQNPDGTSFMAPPCTDNPLCTFFNNFFQGFFCTPGQADGVIAYANAFPTNVKPVVGWQVKPSMPVTPQEQLDINLMITQHQLIPSQNDVVAKGLVNGQPRGFVLLGTDPGIIFESDQGTALTLNDLFNMINSGAAELVFTSVPPGSGFRIGVDQDSDGIVNGLDPMPQVNNDADVNLDGVVDGLDIQPFLTVIFNPAAAADPAFQAADANNDGVVNLLDVDSVVSILLTGGPF